MHDVLYVLYLAMVAMVAMVDDEASCPLIRGAEVQRSRGPEIQLFAMQVETISVSSNIRLEISLGSCSFHSSLCYIMLHYVRLCSFVNHSFPQNWCHLGWKCPVVSPSSLPWPDSSTNIAVEFPLLPQVIQLLLGWPQIFLPGNHSRTCRTCARERV